VYSVGECLSTVVMASLSPHIILICLNIRNVLHTVAVYTNSAM
jgi:hypothetical protein